MARDKEAVEVVLPWEVLDQAAVDPHMEVLVQAVDLLRWVGPEADLHLLEGQQSHNC